MDIVTKNLIASFREEESLPDDTKPDVLFEHFSNFCVISKEYGEEFDIESIHTGGGDDLGIDGIGIIVNGVMVEDVTEIDDLAATNKFLSVEFVFIQTKSAENFSGADIGNFFFGVTDLFKENPTLPRNSFVKEKETLLKHVYSKSAFFKKGNPLVKMYYVTTGSWQDDTKLTSMINTHKDTLFELNIFQEVIFDPIDAREIQKLYGAAKNRLSTTITFSEKLTLPALPGVQESYLGYLPAPEYLKLISDNTGSIVRGLFYDNVRDFQGENPVNQEIEDTLRAKDQKNFFVLMNNGVTIVADEITKTGNTFTLEDYQVVNGCQTSHVLFNNASEIGPEVQIPVKLIVSKDTDVKNKIIKATNRQTPVKPEELTALTDFQKQLEEYYNAIKGTHELFYERRSQQFRAATGIEKIRIVTISSQIRCFASMFLEMPHQASRYYGTLLKAIETKIFRPNHPQAAYYASALALYRLESLIRKKTIEAKYRPFRYQILAIVRYQFEQLDLPDMGSNKFEKYCERLVDSLQDDTKQHAIFSNAIHVLDQILNGDFNRDRAKDASLLNNAKAIIAASKGTVMAQAASA